MLKIQISSLIQTQNKRDDNVQLKMSIIRDQKPRNIISQRLIRNSSFLSDAKKWRNLYFVCLSVRRPMWITRYLPTKTPEAKKSGAIGYYKFIERFWRKNKRTYTI